MALRPSLLLSLLLAAPAAAQGPLPDPNDPGIIDPVAEYWLSSPARLPGSLQVTGNSELVNIVGQVRRRDIKTVPSASGTQINSTKSPAKDLESALGDLGAADTAGQQAPMNAAALELRAILLGDTQGRAYDGFPMLHHRLAPTTPGQLAGEYRMKRLEDRGARVASYGGALRKVWQAEVRLLYADDDIDCDTAQLVIPAGAHPLDVIHITYLIASLERADFAPTTLMDDLQPFGEGRLASKSFDATWVALGTDEATLVTVDHGTVGAIRGVQLWNWRAEPDAAAYLHVSREILAANGTLRLDAKGTAVAERLRALDLDSVGGAAPERKVLTVADAVLAGATPAQTLAMLTQAATAPLGTAQEWLAMLDRRDLLPPEAWTQLALEGIYPNQPGPAPLGPYYAVAVYLNHELRAVTLDQLLGHDPLTGAPLPLPGDLQGEAAKIKILNLDNVAHHFQARDYGPALHDDIATCSYAPAGSHSLEIFSDKPLYGAPKQAELQWRAGWSLRRGIGIVPQYDVFPRAADRGLLSGWSDGLGAQHLGWSYPAALRGGDFVVDPPAGWLGTPPLHEGAGTAGLVIGATTPGYGVAKMPTGDLAAYHPTGALNADLDGDGILDALVFPAWMRNPDPQGGDFVPATPAFEPFLYLSPENGTIWVDPLNPQLGYWSDRSYAFGAPVAAGANVAVEVIQKRALGQAMWLCDGLFRAAGNFPARVTDAD